MKKSSQSPPHDMHSISRRRRPSSWVSFLTVVIFCCSSGQLITLSSAAVSSSSSSKHNNNNNFHSALMLRRRRQMQNNNKVMTIPTFALDFGYIITNVTDTSSLFSNDQQINIEGMIQSALNDFLTETTPSGIVAATYTNGSITSVKYTSATFLAQSTDLNLQTTYCLSPTDCTTQGQMLGATRFVSGDYPFKGCFRRKDNTDTVMFGTEGSEVDMMDLVLNDNLERVFCYKKRVDDGGLNRRRLGDNKDTFFNNNDSGNGGVLHNNNLRRLSVQSAKFTVIVTGGQAVLTNSGEEKLPTQIELRESFLTHIGANGGTVLAAKVKSLATTTTGDYDPTLATLLGDLDTVVIAKEDDQPLLVQSVNGGCVQDDYEPSSSECLAKEEYYTSEMAVNCCSGTLLLLGSSSDLSCSRPNCRSTDSYADAEAHCESSGMRLCTVTELNSGACCDKGCGFNRRMSWTSSVCSSVVVDDDDNNPTTTTSPSPPPIESIEETMSTSPPPMTSPPTREPSTSPTSSPSSNPTSSPTREPSTPPSNSPVTMPITSTPTIGPSNSPIANSPIATSTPTIPPMASATSLSPSAQDTNPCPDGECLDLSGECKGVVQCFAEPCDVNPCEDGEVCTPNYCGGCDRVCSALATSPSPTTASPETPNPTFMFGFGFPTPPPMLSEAPSVSPSKSPVPTIHIPAQLTFVAKGPDKAPPGTYPLGECQGNCYNDNECEGSLVCMRRIGGEAVPGCSGTDTSRGSYCFVDPNPTPTSNAVQLGSDSDGGNDDGNLGTNNALIIAFASAGSLVIALAIGLGFFAMRKHRTHRLFEDKDPAALETTFNQSDFGVEEDIEDYYYDENAEFYKASNVEDRYNDSDQKKSSRFGLGSTFGSSSRGKGGNKNGDKSGNKNSVLKKDQPLSCQDGNGMNAAPIDDIVDDMALDFLAGTGNSKDSKETKEKSIKDFRPKLMSAVAPFKAFQGEDTEEDSDEASKSVDRERTAQDLRPSLMDTFSMEENSEQSSVKSAGPNGFTAPELPVVGQKKEQVSAPHSPHRPDTDSHMILSDIYKASKKSRWEREEKSQVSAPTQTLNDKLAKDLRVHRAKMNSFLDEDAPDTESGRGATKSSKVFNPFSLPQRERNPRNMKDVDSAVLHDSSLFSHSVESKEPRHQFSNYQTSTTAQKKKFAAPTARFAPQRSRISRKSRQNDSETSPDRRFFTFDGDDEGENEGGMSHIPNLIMADDKSGFASAVSSIGQVDWRGRERNDSRRVRFDSRRKEQQREPSVDTIETDDAGAKLVACRSTLSKTKNILAETLERSLHCKARVVSPTSDINDDDDDDDDYGNQVSRPWKAKFDVGNKGAKGPSAVVGEEGYQSSNYDSDSDWDVDDNDLTVDYSAEGTFMPSPLKGVGFDLRR